MNIKQAAMATAVLVVASPREDAWTNEKMDFYTHQFSTWNDAEALMEACETVATTWNWNSPPPIRTVHDAYKAAVLRRQSGAPALPPARDVIPMREGVEIGRRAYHAERYRLGKAMKDEFYESFLARAYMTRRPR